MKAFGLQTFIWENNFKSIVLMFVFPLILSFLGIIVVFSVYTFSDQPEDNKKSDDFICQSSQYQNTPLCIDDPDTTSTPNPFEKTIEALPTFLPIFYVVVGIWFLIAFAFNKQIILKMTHSKPIARKENPEIYNTVENLCISRGLPVPKIYVIEDQSLNAFATGFSPSDASISFSRGILSTFTKEEIEAVAAHELTHIKNQDIRLMVIAIVFVGIIQTLGEIFIRARIRVRGKKAGQAILIILLLKLVVFIVSFFFTLAVQAAISRRREYLADSGSVELTKNPGALISALQKIEGDPSIEVIRNENVAQMFINHPGKASFWGKIFSTHPPVEERIAAIKMIGGVG